MRKTILMGLMAATMISGAASAEPHRNGHRDNEARQHARHDQREVRQDARHDRRDVRQNARHDQRQARQHSRHWTAYAAPVRNWRYRPVTIGYQLQPTFYGSRYFVSDYSAYQLRRPGRFQRWIRYGDDLLLVNVRSGRVLQVVHNRYW